MLITLNEIQAFLGLDLTVSPTVNTYDTILTAMITGAEEWINNYCNQNILTTQVTVEFENVDVMHLLPNFPVSSTGITIKYRANPVTAWTAATTITNYYLKNENGRTYLWRTGAFIGEYQITYSYGYATAPEIVKQVCKEIVAVMFKQGKYTQDGDRVGVNNINTQMIEHSINTVFKDETERWKQMLRKYRRLIC